MNWFGIGLLAFVGVLAYKVVKSANYQRHIPVAQEPVRCAPRKWVKFSSDN